MNLKLGLLKFLLGKKQTNMHTDMMVISIARMLNVDPKELGKKILEMRENTEYLAEMAIGAMRADLDIEKKKETDNS